MNVVSILTESGKRAAVISRGYGRKSKGTVVVSDGVELRSTVDEGGDEPVQIALRGNVIVIADEDRVRGAKKAVKEFGAEVIVLDDGFQHRAIHRSKNILLVDAQRPPYRMMLLPAGLRREPMGSIRRADAVLVTKSAGPSDAGSVINDLGSMVKGKTFSSSFVPAAVKNIFGKVPQSLSVLNNRTVIALSGIASPESFRTSLSSCGANIKEFIVFNDHHRYTEKDVKLITGTLLKHKADFIVTTEKDAVRLIEFKSLLETLPLFSLIMEVVIHEKDAWKKYILHDLA